MIQNEIHRIPSNGYFRCFNGTWSRYEPKLKEWVLIRNQSVINYLNKCYKGTTDRKATKRDRKRIWKSINRKRYAK